MPLHRDYAHLLNELGRRHEAAQHIRVLCKIGDVREEELHSLMVLSDAGTDRPLDRGGRARERFTANDYQTAMRELDSQCDGAPETDRTDSSEVLSFAMQALRGRCISELGDHESWLHWISQDDGDPEAFTNRWAFAESWAAVGTWLVNEQRFDEAVAPLAEAIKLDPTDVRSYRRMRQCLRALQLVDTAVQWDERFNTLRSITLASNELGSTHKGDPARYRVVVEGLTKLGRSLEAVLWTAISLSHQSRSTEGLDQAAAQREMDQLNRTRIELVKSGDAFPSASTRLAGLELEAFPRFDLTAQRKRWLAGAKLIGSSPHRPSQEESFPTPPSPMPIFRDVAAQVGLHHTYQVASKPQDAGFMIYQTFGGGVAVLDYDMDGWCDLYLAQGGSDFPEFVGSTSDQLHRHVDGHLFDATIAAGVLDYRYTIGVTSGDWNQDGFADLAVAHLGANALLINNGDGTFRSEPTDSFNDRTLVSTSIAMADLDGDHLPDIYEMNYVHDSTINRKPSVDDEGIFEMVAVADYRPAMDRLLFNDGRGERFVRPISESNDDRSTGLCVLIANFDTHLGNEVYVGNDVRPNQLWNRQQNGQWIDSAPLTGVALGFDGLRTASMGIAAADFDQSGSFDLHVTNFEAMPSRFYVSRGSTFQDRAISWNLNRSTTPLMGFGTQSLDHENDGRPDLIVTNGHIENIPLDTSPFQQPMQLFLNRGDHFELLENADADHYSGSKHVGRSIARLDFNRDGRSDCIVTHLGEPTALLINQSESAFHWAEFQLVGIRCERDAIGAKVDVRSGAKRWTNWLFGGDGYLCKNEQVVPFGLGDASSIDSVTITWPDGIEQVILSPQIDRRHIVIQGM
ncbi:CRTAC1 family protein [Neorhodopirellula pilleata]|uniref:CRTAC1 family protein n=1 Tax=Neorhodopirellula pilleata TaxID=2714738 RepID=UPI001E4049BA|nr:CRTAC1 family protein [Neorhodopirellula pilleata]